MQEFGQFHWIVVLELLILAVVRCNIVQLGNVRLSLPLIQIRSTLDQLFQQTLKLAHINWLGFQLLLQHARVQYSRLVVKLIGQELLETIGFISGITISIGLFYNLLHLLQIGHRQLMHLNFLLSNGLEVIALHQHRFAAHLFLLGQIVVLIQNQLPSFMNVSKMKWNHLMKQKQSKRSKINKLEPTLAFANRYSIDIPSDSDIDCTICSVTKK